LVSEYIAEGIFVPVPMPIYCEHFRRVDKYAPVPPGGIPNGIQCWDCWALHLFKRIRRIEAVLKLPPLTAD